MSDPLPPTLPDLHELLRIFYPNDTDFGRYVEVTAADVPQPFRKLLAHDEHMTEVMERHHGSAVDVEVLAVARQDKFYARKILLRRQSDRALVQFGIVRLDLRCLAAEVIAEIEAQKKPLGRVLIEHNVLRTVRLSRLWRIAPGPDLQSLLAANAPALTYGRTALIYTDQHPAVELLEVVVP